MTPQLYLGSEFELNTPLAANEWLHCTKSILGPVADDYLEFMRIFNGGEGPVGDENYLALFGLDELVNYNDNLKELYSAADYTVFASNGGNVVFAFNKLKEIIEFDLIGYGPDEAIKLADNFAGFLASLS